MLNYWDDLRRGKSGKKDIMEFERHLEDNLFDLQEKLSDFKYSHGVYDHFVFYDSKRRDIHKAMIKDRIVHKIIYDLLVKIYEPSFIKDSYSSRKEKGTHKAVKSLRYFLKLSGGTNSVVFILKCDVKKYFDSVNHGVLFNLVKKKIHDEDVLEVIKNIIFSFDLADNEGRAIPLGNVTSQIFANIYLNELDDFVKDKLRTRFYVRYNDDFVIVSKNREKLESWRDEIKNFVSKNLLLDIPDDKATIRKFSWGVEFLGHVILPDCVLLRNKTKGKIMSRVNNGNLQSYLGMLKHCNSFNLRNKLLSKFSDFGLESC